VPRALGLSPAAAAIDVVVGILVDDQARVLIAERPEGRHMAGFWEFPGGKLKLGEDPLAGLKRELGEELGIDVLAADPFLEQEHAYPDRTVRLDVWRVTAFAGAVRALEGQALRWVEAGALGDLPILPADAPIVAAIQRRLA
jgi:8-oxo-dGTP diphosphatase